MKLKLVLICTISLFYNSISLSQKHIEAINFTDKIQNYSLDIEEALSNKDFLRAFQNKNNLYIQVDENDSPQINAQFKAEAENSIKVADQVRDLYFLFRYDWDMEKTNIPYSFEDEIDWQANPFGDIEWTFMLNRHRYWVDLGKAYYLTGDEKYAETFVQQIKHWISHNPLNETNTKTTWRRIETGIRAENWIKSFELIKNSKHITTDFTKTFLKSLYTHANYLNQSFSDFSKTSNWGVLEFHGLFNIAMFMPEFKSSKVWKENAIAYLSTCLQNQILEDGTQWEQSPMYHNEILHCSLNVLLLSKRSGIELPHTMLDKIKAMSMADIAWQKPNHHQPLFGDSDDVSLKGILTTASVLLNDPVLKSRSHSAVDYENFFVFTSKEKSRYHELSPKKPDFLSVYQKSSGNFISRTSWESDASYSSLNLNNLGGGHSHDDLLHFTLYGRGQDYLIDSGRYTYVNNEWREYFKTNKAHNTLAVDRLQTNIYSNSWENDYESKSISPYGIIKEDYDYAEVINTAYLRLEDPILMKRQLLFLKPDIWILVDSFKGAKTQHTFSQYFNFADTMVSSTSEALSTTYPKHNLIIKPLNPVEIKLRNAWKSPEYNYKKEIIRAELFAKKSDFTSLVNLIYFEDTKVKAKKISLQDRNKNILTNEQAEAFDIYKDKKLTHTLIVAHNATTDLVKFIKVKDTFVKGEVILITHKNGKQKIEVIK